LDFVLRAEHDPENSPFIGSWTREEHAEAIFDPRYWHFIIHQGDEPQGYLIAIDLRDQGMGVFLKRIVVMTKSKGSGRQAIQAFLAGIPAPAPTHIWLAVGGDNSRARRAYEAVGFERKLIEGVERARLAQAVGVLGEDRVLMFKTLESRFI